MMNYWRIDPDSRNYCILVDDGNDYGSQDFLQMEDARKIDQSRLRFQFDDERPLPIGDFVPTAKLGVLFARREIFDLFSSVIVRGRHTFYTAKTDRYDLDIYVPLEEVCGFDFRRSSYEKFDDGDIYQIDDLRLVDNFSAEFDVFRLKDNFGTRFHVIVSDNFKRIYDDNGITGLRFTRT
ncbi:MAG: hypothetical protein E5V75_31555 [Mesorhizobium sp.]|nr:MAG: hypothetical protein E5V75_31555 [Mesorhizobium sp.]